jgi:hypothetical protein
VLLLREVFGWKGVVVHADQQLGLQGAGSGSALCRRVTKRRVDGDACVSGRNICGAEFRWSVVEEEAGDWPERSVVCCVIWGHASYWNYSRQR